ncbi:hypothetical protein HPP92_005460 [Vanilla planifolia]|uniref:Uncharacterized protein n=1 Tax=Vanilla planifolia TaxID=51239 RepID=A0A835RUH1_VANPL|nr:hypothetical protein HPP92_005460 [Vanilla planifolia]
MGAEGVDPLTFERLSPSRFISFSFPNPHSSLQIPYGDVLRVAVVDSPSFIPTSSPPAIAAILVPHGREDDWIFSTAAGNFQLLLSFASPNLSLSRLVLIGDLPSPSASMLRPFARPHPDNYSTSLNYFKETLVPLLIALCPKAAFCKGVPSVPFLSYEDDVIRCTPVEKLVGPIVGEMLVEDVEIDASIAARDIRRRLRFKRMPNLVQSQVRLLPNPLKRASFARILDH